MVTGDVAFRVIGKMLDGCAERHKVIAANLANAETPGYKRLEVRFEDQLAQAIERGAPEDIDAVAFEVVETEGLPERADGNNVDFGRELGEMTQNSLTFSTLAQLAAMRVQRYREAIGG